ncbi:unnamed protein product [Boreogadus saida]
MSRKKLAWANKEVETFVCILGEEDVVYDVYVAAAAIDIRPTTKGTVGSGNATSELSWAISPPPYRTFAIRSVPHPAVEKRHKRASWYRAQALGPHPPLAVDLTHLVATVFICSDSDAARELQVHSSSAAGVPSEGE